MTEDLAEFIAARLSEDERELQKDPPTGLGYANLPARIRREIRAHRAILIMAKAQVGYDLPEGVHDGRDPDERETDEALYQSFWDVLCVLAVIWSDHPEYRAEWQP